MRKGWYNNKAFFAAIFDREHVARSCQDLYLYLFDLESIGFKMKYLKELRRFVKFDLKKVLKTILSL